MNFLQRMFGSKQEAPAAVITSEPIESLIFPRGLIPQERAEIKARRAIGRRSYNAGIVDRLTADFAPANLAFNSQVRPTLTMMRARSRHLARNEPYTKAFLDAVVRNVVGHDGTRFRNIATQTDGSLDAIANKKIKVAFLKWGHRKTCTVTRRKSWAGAQKLIMRMVARDGEVFIKKIQGFDNPFGFALQIIPCDYIDHLYERERLPNGNRVIMGVEINSYGEPVAYYAFKNNPNDLTAVYSLVGAERHERIEAKQITHLKIDEDSEQVRGIPWIYVAMTRLNQLGAYEEAEVIAARLQSCKMGFIYGATDQPIDADDEDDEGNAILDASPGQIEKLKPGWKFQNWDPTHPNGNMANFTKAMLRGVCAGIGGNYNLIGQDLEGVNFSSIRAGTLDEREGWKVLQHFFIEEGCEDIFESWLECALLTEFLKPLPFAKFDKFNAPYFRGRRWPWVDPEKDMRAAAYAVLMGWRTNEEVCEDMDGDFYENLEKLKEEKKAMEKAGFAQVVPMAVNPVEPPEEVQPPGKTQSA